MSLASAITPRRSQQYVCVEQRIPAQDLLLEATLSVPLGARGIVVLPHASSAGRFDRRHLFGAEVLEQSGLGTLQVDLLTPGEEEPFPVDQLRKNDVSLLADRVLAVLVWLSNQPDLRGLAVGILASPAETAAALLAAERSGRVVALVAKGGLRDSATDQVTQLTGPTLLLLGPRELCRAEELAAEFFGRHLR